MAVCHGRTGLTLLLAELGIETETVEHPPVHTVEEALPYWAALDGEHVKNLFLKGARGEFWLICLPAARRADLKLMAQRLGAKRFSFASAASLDEVLGVEQGGVSPLALINDRAGQVRLVLDAALLRVPRLAFHPLVNTATIAMATKDFLAFLAALGRAPETIELEPSPESEHAPEHAPAGGEGIAS